MTPGGVLAVNFYGDADKPPARLLARTLHSVFGNVRWASPGTCCNASSGVLPVAFHGDADKPLANQLATTLHSTPLTTPGGHGIVILCSTVLIWGCNPAALIPTSGSVQQRGSMGASVVQP